LEYHHIAPEFDTIAEECLALMAPLEIAERFGYSKFIPGRDELSRLIPRDHPAILHLIEAHRWNQWEWLCKAHHRNVRVAAESPAQTQGELFAEERT